MDVDANANTGYLLEPGQRLAYPYMQLIRQNEAREQNSSLHVLLVVGKQGESSTF